MKKPPLDIQKIEESLGADPKRTKKVKNVAEALDHWQHRHDALKKEKKLFRMDIHIVYCARIQTGTDFLEQNETTVFTARSSQDAIGIAEELLRRITVRTVSDIASASGLIYGVLLRVPMNLEEPWEVIYQWG